MSASEVTADDLVELARVARVGEDECAVEALFRAAWQLLSEQQRATLLEHESIIRLASLVEEEAVEKKG